MKSFTHNAFGVGLGLYLGTTQTAAPVSFALGLWLPPAVNLTIDRLGHTTRNGRPVRSWTTHSLFTAPLWGAAIGCASGLILQTLLGPNSSPHLIVYGSASGVLMAYAHLFLDSLTEGGVFLVRSRIAIAHFRNGNISLNAAFCAAGLLLAAKSLTAYLAV